MSGEEAAETERLAFLTANAASNFAHITARSRHKGEGSLEVHPSLKPPLPTF